MASLDWDSDSGDDSKFDELCGDDDQTVGEFAQQLSFMGREAVAVRESIFGDVPMAERRSMMEAQLGKDFVAQLRRADDWMFEGVMRMGKEEDFEGADVKRMVFCFHAAEMTDSCHGTLWPHLKYESRQGTIFSREQALELCLGLGAESGCCTEQMDAANRALGIVDPWDAVPPRRTGHLDLDSLEKASASAASVANGIKGSILGDGTLPALVAVERRDEKEAVILAARCLWRDTKGALLLEVHFMHNSRDTFQAKGSLEPLCLEALVEELGPPKKVVSKREEIGDLMEELRANSAKVSVACHMRRREGFAGGKVGQGAVSSRVVREPLEVSFLQLSAPRSTALLGALDAKARGNARFTAGSLAEALDVYQEALHGFRGCPECDSSEVRDEIGKVHSNMAECHLRQERWPEAIAEAGAALEVDARNLKAFFRRAKAHEAMGQVLAAITDLRSALREDPQNQQFRTMLARLRPDAETPPPSRRDAAASTPPPRTPPGPVARLAPAGWANGLSPAMQYEWLVDCYRMRVDDRYAWGGGGELRGLYAEACGGESTCGADFLLFCKLAKKHGVIPEGWKWQAFLNIAKGSLRCAFEKSDAKEKYGQENVFAVAMGGRSLRYTAEIVYGSSCMSMEASEAEEEMERTIETDRFLDELYQDIGGVAVWREACLAPQLRGGGKGRGNGRGVSGKGAGRSRVCWNYQAGHCIYGEGCHFSHEGPQGPERRAPLCRFWQHGSCSRGNSCRYRHG